MKYTLYFNLVYYKFKKYYIIAQLKANIFKIPIKKSAQDRTYQIHVLNNYHFIYFLKIFDDSEGNKQGYNIHCFPTVLYLFIN